MTFASFHLGPMERIGTLECQVRALTNERDTARANEATLRGIAESYERDLKRLTAQRDLARWWGRLWHRVAIRHRARAERAEGLASHNVPPPESIGWEPVAHGGEHG